VFILKKNIYLVEKGDSLINESNYPKEVVDYLSEEKLLLENLMLQYKVVVVVGCMNGLYMESVIKKGLDYVGLDIIKRYVDQAKKRAELIKTSTKIILFHESAANLNKIVNQLMERNYNKSQIFFFFPFNSFGNIIEIEKTITSLSSCECHFFISTYDTNKFSTEQRENYYQNCSLETMKKSITERSVDFISADGFKSSAYKPEWLIKKLNSGNRNKVNIYTLAKIGLGYVYE
jgi:hypothetical protein